mgnify:CR=1 FL=1
MGFTASGSSKLPTVISTKPGKYSASKLIGVPHLAQNPLSTPSDGANFVGCAAVNFN